jgi:hypothetical protein
MFVRKKFQFVTIALTLGIAVVVLGWSYVSHKADSERSDEAALERQGESRALVTLAWAIPVIIVAEAFPPTRRLANSIGKKAMSGMTRRFSVTAEREGAAQFRRVAPEDKLARFSRSQIITVSKVNADETLNAISLEFVSANPKAISTEGWDLLRKRNPVIWEAKNEMEILRIAKNNPNLASDISIEFFRSDPKAFREAVAAKFLDPKVSESYVYSIAEKGVVKETGQIQNELSQALAKNLKAQGFSADDIEKYKTDASGKLADAIVKKEIDRCIKNLNGAHKVALKEGKLIFSGEIGFFNYEQSVSLTKVLAGALAVFGGPRVVEFVHTNKLLMYGLTESVVPQAPEQAVALRLKETSGAVSQGQIH